MHISKNLGELIYATLPKETLVLRRFGAMDLSVVVCPPSPHSDLVATTRHHHAS